MGVEKGGVGTKNGLHEDWNSSEGQGLKPEHPHGGGRGGEGGTIIVFGCGLVIKVPVGRRKQRGGKVSCSRKKKRKHRFGLRQAKEKRGRGFLV